MGTISILQIDPTCPCILCLYGQLNIFCVFCINMSKSVRVQFTMRFSGAGGFASLCRKSRLCGGLGGKTGGEGGAGSRGYFGVECYIRYFTTQQTLYRSRTNLALSFGNLSIVFIITSSSFMS